jgi:hypothetical protein
MTLLQKLFVAFVAVCVVGWVLTAVEAAVFGMVVVYKAVMGS